MKNVTVSALVALVALAGVAVAQEDVKTTVSVDYVTKYLFYGIDKYSNDDGAVQPSVTMDFGNGFSAGVWGSFSVENGNENAEELNYKLAYSFSAMQDEALQADFVLNWVYYDRYDGPSNANDEQEVGLLVALPNLVGDGFVPHYRVVKLWAEEANKQASLNGWVHALGFTQALTTECPLEEGKEQKWLIGADIVYNDSYVIGNSEWSHALFSLAAPMDCPMGGTLTPSVKYQLSMEDNVNTEDELYFGVNYTFGF